MGGRHKISLFIGYGQFLARRSGKLKLGDVGTFDQVEAQSHGHRCFDASAVDLTVALGRMTITAREERTGHQNRENRLGAGGKVTNIDVAAILAGWDRIEAAVLTRRDPHHSAERLIRDQDIFSEITVRSTKFVMM